MSDAIMVLLDTIGEGLFALWALSGVVRFWSDPDLPHHARDKRSDIERRVSGAVFSVLVALDGAASDLPGFIVAPMPHPTDREFLRGEGEDWFPENERDAVKADIAGELHDLFYAPKTPETGGA